MYAHAWVCKDFPFFFHIDNDRIYANVINVGSRFCDRSVFLHSFAFLFFFDGTMSQNPFMGLDLSMSEIPIMWRWLFMTKR